MNGDLLGVWSWTWQEMWEPLLAHETSPSDLYVDLYRELSKALKQPPTTQQISVMLNDKDSSIEAFRSVMFSDIRSEADLVSFAERAYLAIDDFGFPVLTDF